MPCILLKALEKDGMVVTKRRQKEKAYFPKTPLSEYIGCVNCTGH